MLDMTDERGQLAGYLLAALGAEVIAVEPPGGSRSRLRAPLGPTGLSLAHAAANRGKRSITVDLAAAEGRDGFGRLLEGADVLLVAGTPSEQAALGIDHTALSAAYPRLVVVSISPFGLHGPKADWAATDLTVWAAGGPLALSGDPNRAPVQVSAPQAFLHASATAASGAVLALLERDQSGLGQQVDVSAQLSAMPFTQSAVLSTKVGADLLARSGGGIKSGEVFLRFVYPAQNGHVSITLVFGAAVGPSTQRLMRYLGEQGWLEPAEVERDWVGYHIALAEGREPLAGFESLKQRVAAFTASRTKEDLFALAREQRHLIAPVATTADVLASEQFAARGFWQVIDAVRYPGPWARSAVAWPVLAAAPPAGVDSDNILAEPDRPAWVRPAAPATKPSGASRPLEGLKVLDFMWAVAGPTLSRTLADAGATVLRVESSSRVDPARAFMPFIDNQFGVENSSLFHNLGAGKKSLALDLNRPEGREVALDLARWADVVCESFSPKAMRSFGLDYEQLRAVNPSVVMLSSCLFGQTGPLASFAGYGNLAGAMTGFYNLTGWPDGDPEGPFGAFTDYAAPSVALTTLLAAVDHQRRTGQGQHLDFSQAEASLHFLASALLEYEQCGRLAERRGNADLEMCPHGVFPAAGEDQWVAIVAQDDAAWARLALLVGRADLADLGAQARLGRRVELEALVSAWSSLRSPGQAEAACQAVGVAAHSVQNAPELAVDAQLAHLGHWRVVPHPQHGDTVVEGPRLRLSRTPIGPRSAGPVLGEHVRPVLEELLGYDGARIDALVASGVFD